jgi:hypothetical protein
VSAPLQNTPSSHEVPLAAAVCMQPTPGMQTPTVHGSPSSHSASFGTFSHPSGPHESAVHAIPSSQPRATHALPQHV